MSDAQGLRYLSSIYSMCINLLCNTYKRIGLEHDNGSGNALDLFRNNF